MPDFKYYLEEILDGTTMENFLDTLAEIAYEKADHIRTNWQDEYLANAWERQAEAIDQVSREV